MLIFYLASHKGYDIGERYTLFSTVAVYSSGGPSDCACVKHWSFQCAHKQQCLEQAAVTDLAHESVFFPQQFWKEKN